MTNKRNIYVICSTLSFWKVIYRFLIVDKHIVFNLNHFILYIYRVNRPVFVYKVQNKVKLEKSYTNHIILQRYFIGQMSITNYNIGVFDFKMHYLIQSSSGNWYNLNLTVHWTRLCVSDDDQPESVSIYYCIVPL